MKIAGIIAEFNPFHNGHEYFLNEIRKMGFDKIVCIMSPNFVQRGEMSIFSKWDRCSVALKNGVDLIIELPTPFALSSAENFAFGGIYLLNQLFCVDTLFFGSECGDIEILKKAVDLTKETNFNSLVKSFLKEGKSYPQAFNDANNLYNKNNISLRNIFSPNNILGIEYIKACFSLKSNMKIETIKRNFCDHDSLISNENFASATHLRNLILNNNFKEIKNFVPLTAFSGFSNSIIYNEKYSERAILAHLRMQSQNYFKSLNDTNEGLDYRIFKNIQSANSLEELTMGIKSKRYTLSRIKRIIMNGFLGIDRLSIKGPIPYIRILGMNSNGEEILKHTNASIPVSSSLKKLENFNKECKKFVEIELRASGVYSLFTENNDDIMPVTTEYTKKLIKT